MATLLAIAAWTRPSTAVGLLTSNGQAPVEERIALSIGPARTTLWLQLQVAGDAGPIALIVPVAPGAVLDWSASAWMEALEVATAPRILPPDDIEPSCPGEEPPKDPVHVAGELYHHDPLPPTEVTELVDAAAVAVWAAARGLTMSPELMLALEDLGGSFVAARFETKNDTARTTTLRVVAPTATPSFPLLLSHAAAGPLKVTAWTIASGRTALPFAPGVELDGATLSYDAAQSTSDYDDVLSTTLTAAAAGSSLTECASREALVGAVQVGADGHEIEGVTGTYFERAALYGGGGFDLQACQAKVEAALALDLEVAVSCPEGSIGTVGGPQLCDETVAFGQIAASELRCGDQIDDLAVALSGQIASNAVLTRHSLLIPSQSWGSDQAAEPEATAAQLNPVWTAGTLDLSGCGGDGGGGADPGGHFGGGMDGSGAGAGQSSSGSASKEVPVYHVGSDCGADDVGVILYYVDVEDTEDAPEAYYQEDDCSGDTTTSYEPGDSGSSDVGSGEGAVDGSADTSGGSEDCGGDSGDSYDSGEDCGGDSGDSYDGGEDCGGDSGDSYDSGEDCGGDSGDSYDGGDCGGDSSGGGEGCSGGDAGDAGAGCDGGSGGDCSMTRRRGRRRIPRLSILVMGALALAAPLRRWSRPGRRRGRRRRGALARAGRVVLAALRSGLERLRL